MKRPLFKTAFLAAVLATAATTTQAGWIKRYIYSNMSGTTVTNLFYGTNNLGTVVFPDSPDITELIPPSATDPNLVAQSVSGFSDNYGSFTPGYIEPPETGNYIFWAEGDDETQLWLTTDATDPLNPAKKQMIASVSGYSNLGEWGKYPQQQSAPIYLEKGKQYYMEVLHKEGTGGDFIGWGWQLPSGIQERPMRTFYLQPRQDANDTTVVSGPNAVPYKPKSTGDLTVYDGMDVMLWVDVNLVPPYTVTWQRGSTVIPGATQTYYRFQARTSDNNAQFSVRVNGILYGPVTVYVSADSTRPELVSATVAPGNPTQATLVFSEDLLPITATNLANYTLSTGTVLGAQLLSDARTVVLKTSLLSPNQLNTLTISGIQDLAAPANTIQTVQANLFPSDSTINFRIWYSAVATSISTLRTWSAANSTAASYTNNAFDEERIINATTYQWNLIPLRNNYAGQIIGYITAPETGNYKFGIASDDQSILYLGTSDQRSSKVEVCYRDGSGGQYNFGLATSQRSAYIPLEAGKRYYFEAVYRDGTGSDGVTVIWEKPSDTAAGRVLPSANSSDTANAAYLIPTNLLSRYGTYGNVLLVTNLPATLSAAESTRPVLKVTADGTPPYSYQWYRNDAPISGATAAGYTLPYLQSTDNGATFYVVVTNSFSSVTSAVTALTVTSDTVKPAVASVGSVYKQVIEVRLSEPVTPASATATANYLLLSSSNTPVAITAATQDANDATHITLQTAAMPETDLMKLVVQNLVDLSAAGNVMAPATNTFRANNFDSLARINNSQAYAASASGDQIFVTAGGSDIWGTADQLAYLYKSVTGNFDYKVQGVSVPAVNGWVKAGVMARATTANGARNAFAGFTPVTPGQNTYAPQLRDTTAGNSTSSVLGAATDPLLVGLQGGVTGRPTIAYPSWLRLQRVGNVIYYYYSTNGTNWTFWTFYDSAASTEGPLPATILFGLAVTSHDSARTVDTTMASFSAVDDGVLRFTLQPTNAIVAEGGTANYSCAVAGHSPWIYQWSKNGAPINNATNSTLTLPAVPYSDNNSDITCKVTNPYGEVVTTTVKLLVQQPDNIKPTVATAGSLFKNTIEVFFSEGVTAASANNIANYTLRGSDGTVVAINSATQDSTNAAHVTLSTAALPDCDLVQLACRGLVDLSLAANVMDLQTNIFRANNFDAYEPINNTQPYSARAEGDQIFLTAGGSDIWNAADACAFLYKTVSGNFDFKVKGVSLPAVNAWSKMGPMVRASATGSGDRNLFACFTPTAGQNTYSPQVRTNTSAASSSVGTGEDLLNNLQVGVTARPTVVYPSWLRLQRIGDKFYYYYSTDGTNWTFWTWYDSATSSEGPLPADLYIGLAIASHDTALTVDGVMASFSYVNDGVLRFTSEPVSVTIGEGGNATFTAGVVGRGPYFYQWMKNNVNIPNATGSAVPLTNVPISENGSLYSCRITNPYGDIITSSNALLTVLQDVTKPVVSAVGSLRGTNVGVYFLDSNRVDPVTATDPANYTVNGGAVSVTSATLEPDGLAVMLTLSAPISGNFSVAVRNVKDGAPIPNTMDPVTLQSTVVTWPSDQDLGTSPDPVMPGFAQAIGTDGFYVHAGGSDIWNQADAGHFVYQPVAGDFDVAVRVAGIRQADVWSKAGLMVRVSLDATAPNFLIAATPTNGQNQITMQWRPGTNVTCYSIVDASRPKPSPLPNAWLRVTRADQVFSFYWGTNGTDWTSLYVTNMSATPYPATTYVGLAATAHNNGTSLTNTTGAYFQNLTGLTAPVARPVLTASLQGSNLVLSWTTTDPNFKLQSADSVATSWANDPAIVSVVGTTYTATVPHTAAAKFYRLSKP